MRTAIFFFVLFVFVIGTARASQFNLTMTIENGGSNEAIVTLYSSSPSCQFDNGQTEKTIHVFPNIELSEQIIVKENNMGCRFGIHEAEPSIIIKKVFSNNTIFVAQTERQTLQIINKEIPVYKITTKEVKSPQEIQIIIVESIVIVLLLILLILSLILRGRKKQEQQQVQPPSVQERPYSYPQY